MPRSWECLAVHRVEKALSCTEAVVLARTIGSELALVLGIVLLSGSACVTPGIEQTVVERSKREQPAWVQLPTNTLVNDEGRLTFITQKSHVFDLPLGVKQIQLGALTASQNALHAAVIRQVQAAAVQAMIEIKNQAELSQMALQAVRKIHGSSAEIRDIYYERIEERKPTDERTSVYYRLYVLVTLQRESLDRLQAELGVKLRGAKDPDLRRLADIFKTSQPWLVPAAKT